MNPSSLTILSARDGISIKSRAKFLYQANFQMPKAKKEEFTNTFRFGGHQALRTNLVKGLHAAGIEFELSNQIPLHESNIGLLAGKELLRELTQERKTQIGHLVVGPNLFITPKGFETELQNKRVKQIVVPSQWVADLWAREAPEVIDKIVVWPVGIDFNYWQPQKLKQAKLRNKVIIYVKSQDEMIIDQVKAVLEKLEFLVVVITYGLYSEVRYQEELRGSAALVYIGSSESQGIALLEAWAMDVPTFVYDSKKAVTIKSESGLIYLEGSSYSPAPYLTVDRGRFWSDVNELESHLGDREKFAPRKNSEMFSVENCAIEYVKLFKS